MHSDSYLGYFGKELIDGSASNGDSLKDIILLVVLGVSVLIGVFASQLAGETWESVTNEIEIEKQKRQAMEKEDGDKEVIESLFGFDLPLWIVGAQVSLNRAEARIEHMIETEYAAKVWNCTDDNPPPVAKNPSLYKNSPEIEGKDKGFDIAENISDGFVLSPLLFKAFLKYSDPLYDESKEEIELEELYSRDSSDIDITESTTTSNGDIPSKNKDDDLQKSLQILQDNVRSKLLQIQDDLLKL